LSYTGESTTFFNDSFQNNLPIGGYFLMNLSANFYYENWDFRLFVNNVTDRVAVVDIFGQGHDPIQKITVEPRNYGAQLTWRLH
jgi:outer membrane receptor protein involved in Fe transport